MADINNITIVGRVSNPPQLRALPSGHILCEFSIANNYYVPNKDNEVNFFDVVCFGKLAENANKYLEKGGQVAIAGTLRQERWQGQDGKNYSKVKIIMDSMQFLSNGSSR